MAATSPLFTLAYADQFVDGLNYVLVDVAMNLTNLEHHVIQVGRKEDNTREVLADTLTSLIVTVKGGQNSMAKKMDAIFEKMDALSAQVIESLQNLSAQITHLEHQMAQHQQNVRALVNSMHLQAAHSRIPLRYQTSKFDSALSDIKSDLISIREEYDSQTFGAG